MRIAALSVSALLFVFAGCASTSGDDSPYVKPNSLMAEEIESRMQQIPYQHREELWQNLVWLSESGEGTIPALLRGLQNSDPKVRSSSAWVLGRMRDRRTIPQLQSALNDTNQTVRLEIARTLVYMGDLQPSPVLIEGLDSDKKEVRAMCHEALKSATGRDFGYDHLCENDTQRRSAVLGWRQWWSEYSGDQYFASNYQQRYNVQAPASPMVEVNTTNTSNTPTNGGTTNTSNTTTNGGTTNTSNTSTNTGTNATTNPQTQGQGRTGAGVTTNPSSTTQGTGANSTTTQSATTSNGTTAPKIQTIPSSNTTKPTGATPAGTTQTNTTSTSNTTSTTGTGTQTTTGRTGGGN